MSPTSSPSSTSTPEEATRHPWRENVEALVVAIAVALLFKYFVLEISKIPSGSMQPTLMGNPETGVFDRVLVDKLSMRMRDPKRFEVVVFKHPVENSRIMVKRLVGMPGESLRIYNGDLWTRAHEGEPWEILRKPATVQETFWRTLDVDEPRTSPWKKILGDASWRIEGRSVEAEGPGRARYRSESPSLRDRYTDGYPDVLRGRIQPQDPRMLQGRIDVGDLRLRGDVEANEDLEWLVLQISEDVFTYEFRIPGPAAAGDARPSIEVRESGNVVERLESDSGRSLSAGRTSAFSVWNADDRLGLRFESVTLSLDVAPVSNQRSALFVALEGGGGALSDLTVERDVHYLAQNGREWDVDIPEGHYVVLGDNTQDSADSRDWRAQRWTLLPEEGEPTGDELEITGNFRDRNENPTRIEAPGGERWTRFRDRWGEVHWFPTGEGEASLPFSAPLVPRELIQGRAVATFWPLKPWKGLWRLGWLR